MRSTAELSNVKKNICENFNVECGDGNGSGGATGDDGGGGDGVHGGRGDGDVNGGGSGRGVNEGGDDGDVDGGILVVKVLIVNQSYVYSCPCIHV